MKKGKSGHAESVSKSEGTEKMQRDVKKEIAEGRKKKKILLELSATLMRV